jgi:carboxypeptidase C (cathepsin A)
MLRSMKDQKAMCSQSNRAYLRAAAAALFLGLCFSESRTFAQDAAKQEQEKATRTKSEQSLVVKGTAVSIPQSAPADSTTEGSVTIGGKVIPYRAVAGTITVGATEPQDALLGLDGKRLPDTGEKPPDPEKPEDAPPTARMFYAAYFQKGAPAESRPITFFYNGGPGSSTMWLHMGAFGPRRVTIADAQRSAGAAIHNFE